MVQLPVDLPIYTLLFRIAGGLYLTGLVFYVINRDGLAVRALFAGWLVHTLSQLSRCWRYEFFSLEGVFIASYFVPWCLASLILLLWCKQHRWRRVALSVLVPLCAIVIMVIVWPPQCHHPNPFTPHLTAHLFFIFEGLSHGCFILSGWLAIQFLRGKLDVPLFNRYAVWGFVFYSITQLTGLVWTYLGWGGLFHWGTRHMHSAALWCCYCSYLHMAFVKGFDLRKKAGFAVIGAILALLLFYVLPMMSKQGRTAQDKPQQHQAQGKQVIDKVIANAQEAR